MNKNYWEEKREEPVEKNANSFKICIILKDKWEQSL